jgi:streptothricin acetyltransferase
MPHIRRLRPADLPQLKQIDATFVTDAILAVEKTVAGLNVTWRLTERPLAEPLHKTEGYIVDDQDVAEVRSRLLEGDGLYLVAEEGRRLVGLLDMERERWRDTAVIWNLLVDKEYRRRGLGREFIHRAIAWGRSHNLRALTLETQTDNVPACRFYRAMGFQLGGIDDHYYTNHDIARNEVAIFWWYELSEAAAP